MDDSERHKIVEKIKAIIEGREDTIIPAVEGTIDRYISTKPLKECLTLVARDGNNIVETFMPPPNIRYVKALTAFVLKRDFERKTLDSGLSEGTAQEVAQIFATDLGEVSDEMSETIVPFLFRSEKFLDGIAAAVMAAYKGPVPVHLSSKVTGMLASKLKTILAQHMDTVSVSAIKASIAKIASASVSSPFAAKIVVVMVQTLTTSMKPILIKIFASTTLKTAILAKIKTVIIASFLGAFIKLLAVKIGLSTGAAFAWVILPILGAWLAYEALHFPEKLASNVSRDVARDLREGFPRTSETIAVTIVEMAITQATAIITRELVQEDDVAQVIQDIMSEAVV
jgi:hypothetical protein